MILTASKYNTELEEKPPPNFDELVPFIVKWVRKEITDFSDN